MATTKPQLTFWQIWNMSFGFLGIQFGWGLQMANMSSIYEYLGATPDKIPMLWLAAPLTGLIVQPIIGYMSDRTWTGLGRRRPYFLAGAILSSIALVLMPNSSTLWMAAGLLWVLDASINISMEPFRAFVADMLPENQRTRGFAMQSLFIGLGSVIASALPFLMSNFFGVANTATAGEIPLNVRLSFYIGAFAFFTAIMYTILTTREYPPDNIEEFEREKQTGGGLAAGFSEITHAIKHMPQVMRQLAVVQFFTWLGLFCMWLFFGVAVARNVLGAPSETSPLYQEGTEWGGVCFSFYSLVTFLFAFALPSLAERLGRKQTHALCLLAGAIGLISVALVHNKYLLLLSMVGVGVAWASIVSMPYAMLSGSLPANKVGIFMGIFNFFIVIPEIIQALVFGSVMEHVLGNNRLAAVVLGGVFLLIAALFTLRVNDPETSQ